MNILPTELIAALRAEHPTIKNEVVLYYSSLAERLIQSIKKEMPEEMRLGYLAGGGMVMNMVINDIVAADFELDLEQWLRPKSDD